MKEQNFSHPELSQSENLKIVFASFSKKLFYLRAQISAFILLENYAPFNPYMNFEYNLSGTVDKRHIRIANNTMINKCDELWVFGEISDGVLVEIYMAKKIKKKVRFFIPNERIDLFEEIPIEKVMLEDVSAWMWEFVIKDRNLERWHPRLRFQTTYPLVFPAYSKKNFYWQMHISKFCIDNRFVPLNPFMLFRYFLSDMVQREKIYAANNAFVRLGDVLWTFDAISNGVLAEMILAKKYKKPIKHFNIVEHKPEYVKFRKISNKSLIFEEDGLGDIYSNSRIS
ncbi:MAG: DUF4406 domain-containing protein [Patescibacteria group bacterium]